MRKHIHHQYDTHLINRSYEKEKRVPLSGTFMLTSMLGFLISAIYTVSGRFNDWFIWSGGPTKGYAWGTAFMVVFLVMFIASVVSVTPTGKDWKKMK